MTIQVDCVKQIEGKPWDCRKDGSFPPERSADEHDQRVSSQKRRQTKDGQSVSQLLARSSVLTTLIQLKESSTYQPPTRAPHSLEAKDLLPGDPVR